MKIYTAANFFKHTFCDFTKVNEDFFTENEIHFKSKAGSNYSYTKEGVYRYSNHWGRVANCRWKLIGNEKLKSQNFYLGFASWSSFYPLDEKEKQFCISVNYDAKEVNFHHKNENEKEFLFFVEIAQKRAQHIKQLLTDDKWARYFDTNIEELRKGVISDYINSNKTLQEIKAGFH